MALIGDVDPYAGSISVAREGGWELGRHAAYPLVAFGALAALSFAGGPSLAPLFVGSLIGLATSYVAYLVLTHVGVVSAYQSSRRRIE